MTGMNFGGAIGSALVSACWTGLLAGALLTIGSKFRRERSAGSGRMSRNCCEA
jgi:hypothetical protein